MRLTTIAVRMSSRESCSSLLFLCDFRCTNADAQNRKIRKNEMNLSIRKWTEKWWKFNFIPRTWSSVAFQCLLRTAVLHRTSNSCDTINIYSNQCWFIGFRFVHVMISPFAFLLWLSSQFHSELISFAFVCVQLISSIKNHFSTFTPHTHTPTVDCMYMQFSTNKLHIKVFNGSRTSTFYSVWRSVHGHFNVELTETSNFPDGPLDEFPFAIDANSKKIFHRKVLGSGTCHYNDCHPTQSSNQLSQFHCR